MLTLETVSNRIERVTWHEISDQIADVNPALSDILNELSLGENCPLYKVKYPYGQKILHRGNLQLPSPDGRFLPADHPDIDSVLQNDLSYIRGMPVGIVLNRSMEMFITVNGRVTPFSLMNEGKIFGLWAQLNQTMSCERGTMWNITAGARSIFMLPKITDSASHKRLQRMCGLLSPAPKMLHEHWHIFSELASHDSNSGGEEWCVELLFFTKEWVEKQREPLWRALRLFLFSYAWDSTAFWRNQFIYDVEFYSALENNNLKPDPYLVDTARYTLGISAGTQTGFGVAIDDSCAPISFLQKVYTEVYNIPYAPTIMQPMYFNPDGESEPVYYSLHFPTMGGFSPKGRKLASKKYSLKEIKYIMQKTIAEFGENKFDLDYSPVSLYNLTRSVQFRYFHTEDDKFGEIQHASEIIHYDGNVRTHLAQNEGQVFCDTSIFLCGCIQIAKE